MIRWLVLVIAVGCALRCVWLDDMEYKGDQRYVFETCQAGEWPMIGMPSGVELRNPGMSLWVHLAWCKLFSVQTPMGLAWLSPVLATLALILLAVFALRVVPDGERAPWLWTIALSAVSTLSVSWHRIIWSQSVLPLFSVAFLWAWWKRDHRAGAFFWGFIGALLGQIHMSGFFFAFVFFAGECLFATKQTRFGAWFIGSVLGALPLLPWLQYLASEPHASAFRGIKEILTLRFFGHWFSEPLGAEIGYRLGPHSELAYLKWPPVALAHVAIAAIALAVLWNAVRHFQKPHMTETWRAIAFAFASGLLMTLVALRVHKHYLMVAFPLPTVFFCAVALWSSRRGPKLLAGLWVAQLVLTVCFLLFVHEGKAAPEEEYGVPYRRQQL